MAEALQAAPPQAGSAGLARRRHDSGNEGGRERGRQSSGSRPGGVDPGRQRRARMTTLALVVLVLVLYFGFIAYAVLTRLHSRGGAGHARTHATVPAGQAAASRGAPGSRY